MNRKLLLRSLYPALIVAVLLTSCGRQTVHVTPPGAVEPGVVQEVEDLLPVHRLLLLHGFNGAPWELELYWQAAIQTLPARCEVYIVAGMARFMGAREVEGPEVAVADLERFIEDQGIPYENLHLVAHSMGGLVARRFATLHPEALRQVFLVGTPNGGVRMLHGLNFEGWCTPAGIGDFNAANPPLPGIRWYLVAGDKYSGKTGGAFWEGSPNDGVVATASVLRFAELCADSVQCESLVLPLIHPDINWGENLLRSPRVIGWVLERVQEDLDLDLPMAPLDLPGPSIDR